MLKNPTTSVIVLIVTAVIIICIYIIGAKPKTEVAPVEEAPVVTPVSPVDNAVETVVTPVTATPAE